MSDDRNLLDDAVLIELLAETLDEMEPLRPELIDAVQSAAFTSRDLNAELADLVSDSAVSASVRDDGGERLLSFAASGMTIDVDLMGDDVVSGVIAPSLDATVTLETSDGHIPLAVDDLGRFVTRTTSRRLRVRIVRNNEAPVVTQWVIR